MLDKETKQRGIALATKILRDIVSPGHTTTYSLYIQIGEAVNILTQMGQELAEEEK